jgi:two-component system response regulator PilR (NtrC family)
VRILAVDDELSMREFLDVLLVRAGYEVQTAASATAAREKLAREEFDLVISDMKLGQESGLSVLEAVKATSGGPEVILITAYGTPASAVEAMRRGAYDYISKPFDNEEFLLLVQKALEKRALRQENVALRSTLGTQGALLMGQSRAIREVAQLVEKVAPSRSTVLITGESGTGKELVARAIHWRSGRSGQPFLPVNCGALNEGVLESELFGHVKGAFTGATSQRRGILVAAGTGTVFLDELGEVPPAMQVKLLRVLQERRVKPVGSSEELQFEARILAATNRSLEKEVAAGRFREDLFYRLNVITIELPPLRERREDIPLLVNHFLGQVAKELGRSDLRFSDEALRLLSEFSFPGNVRQLQNIVERAATLADGDLMQPETLPPALRGERERRLDETQPALPPGFSLDRYMDEAERRYLLEALRRAGGVKTRAAELLGLSFRVFRYRLAKHGLTTDEEGGATHD